MMKLTTKISVTAASLAVLVSMGGIAATAGAHENDASAVTQANVSLLRHSLTELTKAKSKEVVNAGAAGRR